MMIVRTIIIIIIIIIVIVIVIVIKAYLDLRKKIRAKIKKLKI